MMERNALFLVEETHDCCTRVARFMYINRTSLVHGYCFGRRGEKGVYSRCLCITNKDCIRMVILIAGDTHTGKTLLAQRLLEKYKYPYLSIDHLKIGLIRSGLCPLRAESGDEELTAFLWPVVREMIKTCVENAQNLIVEGCYIPFDWKADFPARYAESVRYVCLILAPEYIDSHFEEIVRHENAIERRMPSELKREELRWANERNLRQCQSRGYRYLLIDGDYSECVERFLAEGV